MKSRIPFVLFAALAVAGCEDTTNLELKGVAVSFATRSPTGAVPTVAAAPAVAAKALDDTVTANTDTLILTRVEVILRQIELKPLEVADCGVDPKPAGCEEVELGPVLVDLPLESGAFQRFSADVPPGTYQRIDLEVHKLSGGDPEDAVIIQANPDLEDQSIRVQGTFNGTAFTFRSDVNLERELNLQPPLVVTDMSASTNLTILVDVGTWFIASDGSLIDPASANKGGPNESFVANSIVASFKAFEDRDRDGDDSDEG